MSETNWIEQPDRDGWWEWMCGGDGEPERLLLCADGRSVAYDDEWEEAMGRSPNPIYSENYWEGTDTTPDYMPGLWRYAGPVLAGKEAVACS
jgi:hypothetical protein